MPTRLLSNCLAPLNLIIFNIEVLSIMNEWGSVDLKLDNFLKENNISRSSLSRNGQIYYKQLLKYCNNDMQKVDLNLLARICKTLNCEIGDIITYNPPKAN